MLGIADGGLDDEQASERGRRYGPNTLPPAGRRQWWRQLASRFTDLFAVVLTVASAITFVAYALEDPRPAGTLQLAVRSSPW